MFKFVTHKSQQLSFGQSAPSPQLAACDMAATAVAHASASECSSSSVAARKFAAVAGKVTRAMAASKAIDFLAEARPWDEYVRGNVVSHAAARLIQSFLLNTMAASGKTIGDAPSEADASEEETDIPTLKIPCQKFQ